MRKGEAGRSVGVSCRDFVPLEKAKPFQVVQLGGIVEKPKGFRKMPPTMHESTKHPQRGRRPVSIDQFPKINGSGIPDSLPFHKKYVARPQKSFRIDPFFKRGRRGAGRGPAKRTGCRAGTLRKELGGDRKENDEKHFIGFFRSAFHRFSEKFFYFCQGILFKP